MEFLRRFWKWIAAAGVTAAVATPMALSQGGSIDVLVGSTPTPSPTATATPTPTPTPDPGTANIWVESGAGTCPGGRSSSLIAYADSASPDRRCGTIDQAWDAASAGDTIRIRPGTFSAQTVSGNKASETFVIGDDGVTITSTSAASCGYQEGALCANANFMTLRNVDLDSQDDHGASIGAEVNGDNVTWEDVNVRGLTPGVYINAGGDFTWSGGEHGEDQGGNPPERSCANGDGQPFQFEDDNGTIEGVYFWPNASSKSDPTCGEDNSFHLESIRVQGATDTVIRNNVFAPSEAGSGHIFFSGGVNTNQLIEGNYFSAQTDGSTAAQNASNVTSCAFTWRHNHFEQPFAPTSPCSTNGTWEYNSGVRHCGGTHTGNYWASGAACTGDVIVGGSLGITSSGIQSGSALIDNGPATCSTLTPDYFGVTRPQGSACDVGPFERVP